MVVELVELRPDWARERGYEYSGRLKRPNRVMVVRERKGCGAGDGVVMMGWCWWKWC